MYSEKKSIISRKYLILFIIGLFILSIGLFYSVYLYSTYSIPDSIFLVSGEEQDFNFNLPVSAEITVSRDKTASENEIHPVYVPSKDLAISADSNSSENAKKIHLSLSQPFSFVSNATGSYSMCCKLLGVVKIKDVQVNAISRPKVIPCGIPVGIYLETSGVLIVGTGEVSDLDGNVLEPALNIVKSGDYIQKANGNTISGKSELIDEINRSNGNDVVLGILRDGEYIEVSIPPVKTEPHSYKLGIWVRDNAQGIGTLTYLSMNHEFGALGHGIADVDTGILMNLKEGTLYETKILSIEQGTSGSPGELMGVINYKNRFELGSIAENSHSGIFGVISNIDHFQNYLEKNGWIDAISPENALDVGFHQDIQTGTAYIQCELDGEIKQYSIEIMNVSKDTTSYKGVEFKVTDDELLSITGGIVQGMSGSPIIQNGKIIAAVTHVFVNDPTRGYGIFIENMLGNA